MIYPVDNVIHLFNSWVDSCLVPRPHFSSRPKRFGSRGPCENVSRPFASDKSPKRIDREGLGKRRTGTRQGGFYAMNFGFLELDSEYQSPGFQIPQEIISPTPDSTGKNFLESGTGLPGTARKKMRKYPGVGGGGGGGAAIYGL